MSNLWLVPTICQDMNIPARCYIETTWGFFIKTQRNPQFAVDLARRVFGCLETKVPGSYLKSKLQINTVNAGSSVRVKLGNVTFPKQHRLLPFKNCMQSGRVLMALVKWRGSQIHHSKRLLSIVSNYLNATIVYANLLVRVSDGDVECKVVVESAVVGVGKIELGQRGIGDPEFGLIRGQDVAEHEEG